MKKISIAFFAVIIFGACRKTTVETDELNIPFRQCVNKSFGSDAVTVCYDLLLEDSRCPFNAMCIWSGVAKAQFSFHVNTTAHTVTLSTLSVPGQYSRDTTIGNYKIELEDIYPYPGAPNPPAAKAVVKVTKM